jgi:hypothetical protein
LVIRFGKGGLMTDEVVVQLVEEIRKLTVTANQVADSLVKLEAICIDAIRKQDEDRVEAKERQKKFDEDQEDFKKRQKKWDEQDWWLKNPWVQPRELAYFLLAVALAAMAIALARR